MTSRVMRRSWTKSITSWLLSSSTAPGRTTTVLLPALVPLQQLPRAWCTRGNNLGLVGRRHQHTAPAIICAGPHAQLTTPSSAAAKVALHLIALSERPTTGLVHLKLWLHGCAGL